MMVGYWTRQRLFLTVILAITVAVTTVFLFVFPCIEQNAILYNGQSVYKNTSIDFVVPEPSFDQVSVISGTNGVASVFPYYLTNASVNFRGIIRTSTVLISDQENDLDMTMYNSKRLIRKSNVDYDNPIIVDWQFCHDTSADIGDTITIDIMNQRIDYSICAVYETNTLYSGGALLIQATPDQIDLIRNQSASNGFSGMFVVADDYDICRQYLVTDYRPLGRLRSRDQFSSDEQYQIHYDAIMSLGFSNEITDLRIMESSVTGAKRDMLIWLGAILSFVIITIFNFVLRKRGCEKAYFTKYCILNGKNVKPYYVISFVVESVLCLTLFAIILLIRLSRADDYIPAFATGIGWIAIPIAIILAESINLVLNFAICKAAK